MASADVPALPNPFTPMAFLPPDIARQISVASDVIVGTLAIMIWDIIIHLSQDHRLLFKFKVGLPTLTYFVSRLGSLAYILASAIFYTAPAGNCHRFEKILDAFFPIAVSSSSLLFFFRVKAVYDREYWVIGFFFFLWLCVVGGTMTVAFGVVGVNIGPTDYCINFSAEPYVGAAGIIPLIHDTSVFIAITWKLMANAHINFNLKQGLRVALFGDYLPAFSKALLQDGQTYYLITVVSNILTVVLFYTTSIPVTYRTIFSAPNIMLINVMACQVFRHTKFGLIKNTIMISTSKMQSSGHDRGAAVIPLSLRHGGSQSQGLDMENTFSDTLHNHSVIEVTKTVEYLPNYNTRYEKNSHV